LADCRKGIVAGLTAGENQEHCQEWLVYKRHPGKGDEFVSRPSAGGLGNVAVCAVIAAFLFNVVPGFRINDDAQRRVCAAELLCGLEALTAACGIEQREIGLMLGRRAGQRSCRRWRCRRLRGAGEIEVIADGTKGGG